MKKLKIFFIIVLLSLFVFLPACEDYVNNVEPLIDYATDEQLNSEGQVDFLITGVLSGLSGTADQTSALMDLLSDQIIFSTNIPRATYPQYVEIEAGAILTDNTTVTALWAQICTYRFRADDVLRRADVITFTDPENKKKMQIAGYFHGGLARFYMALAFGLNKNQPGGVINAGPFIPQTQLLDEAITKYKAALALQTDAAQKRIINSLIAKVYLAKKDYVNAAAFAAQGMIKNDAAYVVLHQSSISNNYYWTNMGIGRTQGAMNSRFNDYIKADTAEANRIKIYSLLGSDKKVTYYIQKKYDVDGSSFIVMTWQENNLMLAECKLRGSGTGDALALVNEVRTSHSLKALTAVDLDVIWVERDKELMCQGDRLMDQNRWDNKWHLAADTWHYMPIPMSERNANPNLSN